MTSFCKACHQYPRTSLLFPKSIKRNQSNRRHRSKDRHARPRTGHPRPRAVVRPYHDRLALIGTDLRPSIAGRVSQRANQPAISHAYRRLVSGEWPRQPRAMTVITIAGFRKSPHRRLTRPSCGDGRRPHRTTRCQAEPRSTVRAQPRNRRPRRDRPVRISVPRTR